MSHAFQLNFDELRAAADGLYHMLERREHRQRPSSPGRPCREPQPGCGDLTGVDHNQEEIQQQSRRGSAEEANPVYRDEILARHIDEQENRSSLIVEPEGRLPRYSPVRPLSMRDLELHDDRDEALARQVQDQYNSSLTVEQSDSGLWPPRYSQPSRYRQVVDEPWRRHSFEIQHQARDDKMLARQIQDQYNSSLAVLQSDRDPDPRRLPRSSQLVGEPSRRHSWERRRHGLERDEFLSRQIQDQYNSSFAVSPSTHGRPPLRYVHVVPNQHLQMPEKHLSFKQPGQEPEYQPSTNLPDEIHHKKETDDFSPLINPKSTKEKKKQQIRAKDHEQTLRWLACRRALGRR